MKGPMIKICGIKTLEEVNLINKYPLTYAGFIFAKSKRQVTIDQARVLAQVLREDIIPVGVFMDQEEAFIKEVLTKMPLKIIQLHGDEGPELASRLGLPVWKAIGIRDSASLHKIKAYKEVDGLLLDTYHEGQSGGTGKVFNWDLIKDLTLPRGQKLILAGGLSADNAVAAYQATGAHILDLNSGLETDLIKDPIKVEALFKALEEAFEA